MYAPFGIGVLVGPIKEFEKGNPDYSGGGTVDVVTPDIVTWDDPPAKEEAGTPNLMGVVALKAAIKNIENIGMNNIVEHEKYLFEYLTDRIYNIKGITLYGEPYDRENRVGILPFNIEGIHNSMTSEILSCEFGIAVRNGCFCAQPYIQKLLKVKKEDIEETLKYPDNPRPGMVRISFGLYNTIEEIDYLIRALKYIVKYKNYFIRKYETGHSRSSTLKNITT
jgi:selenocysteine lyase/cysteine desulfurase